MKNNKRYRKSSQCKGTTRHFLQLVDPPLDDSQTGWNTASLVLLFMGGDARAALEAAEAVATANDRQHPAIQECLSVLRRLAGEGRAA